MENIEEKASIRPRVVVLFDGPGELREFKDYAKSKCLDVRSFLKFAGKAYMDKYPRGMRKGQ